MAWLANVVSSAAQLAILFLVRFGFLFATRLVFRLHRRRRTGEERAIVASRSTSTLHFDSATAKAGGFVDGLFVTDGLGRTRTRCAFGLASASAVVCAAIAVGLVALGSPRVRNSVTTNRPMLLDLAADGGLPADVHRPTESCVQRARNPYASSTITARTNLVCVRTAFELRRKDVVRRDVFEVVIQGRHFIFEDQTYNLTGLPRTGIRMIGVYSTEADIAAINTTEGTIVFVQGQASTLSPVSAGDLAHQSTMEYVLLPELTDTDRWDEGRAVLLAVMKTWALFLARDEFGGATCSAARNTLPKRTDVTVSIDWFTISCAAGVAREDAIAALREALFSHLVLKETTFEDPGGNIVTAVFAKNVERGIPPIASAVLVAVAVTIFCVDFVVESQYVSKARFAMHTAPDGWFSRFFYGTECGRHSASAAPAAHSRRVQPE
jgi:hypothetical protein